MPESSNKTKLFGFGPAWQRELMLFCALAVEICRKSCVAKGGLLKAQYRFLAVCVTGMTVVRGLMGCAVNRLRRKDLCSTNQLDQVVFVYCINTLQKLSILLLELSIAAFDRRYLLLQRIERLAEIECLLKQFALDFQELVFIAHTDKAFRNG